MIKLIVRYTLKKDSEKDFLNVMNKMIEETKNENGCLQYDLYKDESKEQFILIESWENKNSLDAHKESSHFKKYVPLSGEYVEDKDFFKLKAVL